MMVHAQGMGPGKVACSICTLPRIRLQEHKFFDSADWALNKEAASKQGGGAPGAPAPVPVPEEKLKPKVGVASIGSNTCVAGGRLRQTYCQPALPTRPALLTRRCRCPSCLSSLNPLWFLRAVSRTWTPWTRSREGGTHPRPGEACKRAHAARSRFCSTMHRQQTHVQILRLQMGSFAAQGWRS